MVRSCAGLQPGTWPRSPNRRASWGHMGGCQAAEGLQGQARLPLFRGRGCGVAGAAEKSDVGRGCDLSRVEGGCGGDCAGAGSFSRGTVVMRY
jgi:hypothetical protein